ncbi:MAG: protein translocase subunit SecD, partial [Actinomycetota bacterium]|nr:protein translocase subunit SecD [Actinomycetota bacterium]
MRRLKHLRPLIFIVLVAVAAMGVVVGTGTTPQLGLDLQGGVSVVLQPTTEAADDALSETVEIIRNRVDALGVAEPEIVRQGDSVIVQLPGVKNQERALDLVGDTAELRFRPVLSVLPTSIEELLESTSTTAPGDATTTTVAGEPTTTVAGDTTTSAAPVEGQSAGRPAMPFQDATTTTVAPTDTTPTTVAPIDPTGGLAYTTRDDDLAEAEVVLPEYDGDDIVATYNLGPSLATGEIVSKANASLGPTGQWTVELEIKGGSGIEAFNAAAATCFGRTETCPTSQLAIVLDSRVVSAPTIERPSFERDQIQISGNFGESEAKDLALKLRYGSLPVNLEPQTVQTVSATLGEDSLRAGLIAGLIGLALVALYMLVYYRALGLVVVLGLAVWSALNYATICWLSESQGLALSLAGVTGLVISVGVTVDSYVVYFERLKDEVAVGRTLRSSIERSFKRAFRTILAANLTSLIGAVLLYWLTVGPVRGFAFTLALATFFDIVVAWFFIRPMVEVFGRSRLFTDHPVFGVARGLSGKAVKEGEARRRSIWARLYHGETNIDFVGRFRRWLLLSGVVIVAGLVSLGVRGLNLGIDFEGGVVWEVPAGEVTVSEAQDAMDEQGITEATVQTLESDDGVLLRVESEALDTDLAREVSNRLAELTGSDIEDVNLTSVGPSWGDEISEKALRALIVFLVVVTIYISFRFELRMALPTLAALIHDVLVTVGVYSIFGFEVTPATVIAVLTILGFSIYDGIVVFDKVEENVNQVSSAGQGTTYGTMVNRSLNEVLMRSLNTSITAVFPVLSLLVLGSWILGASTLEEFGLALLIGLISGAYSSLYIATPLHAWMKEREPKYKAIKEKVAAKRPAEQDLATVGAGAAPAGKAARGWGAARPASTGGEAVPPPGDVTPEDEPAPADERSTPPP